MMRGSVRSAVLSRSVLMVAAITSVILSPQAKDPFARRGYGSFRCGVRMTMGWFDSAWWRRVTTTLATIGVIALGAYPGSVSAAPDTLLERDLVAITNLDRTSNGLSSLIEDSRLIELARYRSDDMLAQEYFSHDVPPDGEKVFAEMQRRGIEYQAAGENLSWNNAARNTTVQTAQRSFMNSPTHRANVLREDFVSMGTGAIPGTGAYKFTGVSEPISVVMFTALFLRPFDVE